MRLIHIALLFSIAATAAAAADADRFADEVLVTVDGTPITESDLEFLALSRRLPDEAVQQARKRLIGQLVDRQLMRSYLESQKAVPTDEAIQEQIERLHEVIRSAGEEPQAVLARLGFDERRLRTEVSLPLAWQIHLRRTVTNDQLREYFGEHREQFDGTEVRASQIFFKLPADADEAQVRQAEEKLRTIRQQIVDGEVSFADAAREHSEAPSAKRGGDVGFFPYRGKMLVEFSRAAFPLKKGELSEPFRTRFGLHLLTVTDRRPGQLSLEDVRPLVYNALSRQAWKRIVAEQHKRATIEWHAGAE